MKTNSTRLFLLLTALLLLVAIWWTRRSSSNDADQASAFESDRTKSHRTNSNGLNPFESESEPAGPASRPKRPLLDKPPEQAYDEPEFLNRIEKDGPDVLSSEAQTFLPAGHSMVTGGYLKADGRHGFVVVTPKWVDGPNGGERRITVETGMLTVDDKGLAATGLSSLVTNQTKLKQNAEVWTPEDVDRSLKTIEGVERLNSPSVTTIPGKKACIECGSGSTGFRLELETSEGKDGGFEMRFNLKLAE